MDSRDVAVELADAVGQTLPAEYLAFLDRLSSGPGSDGQDAPLLRFDDRTWRPYDRKEMAEPVRYNRDEAHPKAHETRCIAQDLRAMDASSDGEASSILTQMGFTLDRLSRGFCIGDDDNGEPLFVDAETGEVYAYYHDGMDLELWADSLVEFVTESRDQVIEDES